MGAWFVSRTHEASEASTRYEREREQMALELDRARQERARAERVAELVTGLFRLDEPLSERGNSITAREILDQAAYDASRDLTKNPDTQTQILYIVARAYLNLGLLNSANRTAQIALQARRKLYGNDDRRTLESTAQLGWILGHQGQGAEAQRMQRDTLEREQRVLGVDSESTLETMRQLAIIDRSLGDHAEEQRLLQQAANIEARRRDAQVP